MSADLRLAPAALGTWALSLVAITAGPVPTAVVALMCLTAAAVGAGRFARAVRAGGSGEPRHRLAWLGRGAVTALVTLVLCGLAATLVFVQVARRDLAVRSCAAMTGEVTAVLRGEPRVTGGFAGLMGSGAAQVRIEAITGDQGTRRCMIPGYAVGLPLTARVGQTWQGGARLTAGREGGLLVVFSAGPALAAEPTGVMAAVAGLREGLRDAVATDSPQARGLVPGVAIGDDRALPADMAEAMRAVGLTHLTAVSGAHVALVVGLAVGLCGRAPPGVRATVGALVLSGLVLLVLPEASVIRAGAMGAVALAGMLTRRPGAAVPGLAVAVLLLLMADPWLATSLGFALSVAATAGLLLLTPALTARLARWLPGWAAFALAVPVAAQVACTPVLVLLNPALPLYSVLANLLAAPVVAPATVLGLAATVAGAISPPAAHLRATAAGWCTAWIAAVAQATASLPGALVPWWSGVPGAVALAALWAGIAWLMRRRHVGRSWEA